MVFMSPFYRLVAAGDGRSLVVIELQGAGYGRRGKLGGRRWSGAILIEEERRHGALRWLDLDEGDDQMSLVGRLGVDVSYVAPQAHGIVNVALHREYPLGIIFIFFQGRKYLYHV
jgi:hypothetical protein